MNGSDFCVIAGKQKSLLAMMQQSIIIRSLFVSNRLSRKEKELLSLRQQAKLSSLTRQSGHSFFKLNYFLFLDSPYLYSESAGMRMMRIT